MAEPAYAPRPADSPAPRRPQLPAAPHNPAHSRHRGKPPAPPAATPLLHSHFACISHIDVHTGTYAVQRPAALRQSRRHPRLGRLHVRLTVIGCVDSQKIIDPAPTPFVTVSSLEPSRRYPTCILRPQTASVAVYTLPQPVHPYNPCIINPTYLRRLEKQNSMARIYPFRALRYDPARVNMEDVVTQPYDKITPAMQERYYEASPYNLIRVILGKHEPGDTEPQEFLPAGEQAHNVYTRAAEYPPRLAQRTHPRRRVRTRPLRLLPDLHRPPHRRGPRAPRLHRPRPPLRLRRQGRLPPRADLPQAQVRPPRPLQGHPRLLRADLHALLRPRLHRRKTHLRGSVPNGFDDNPADLAITDEYGVVHKRLEAHRPQPHQPHRHRHGRQEAHHRRRPPPLRDLRRLRQGAHRPAQAPPQPAPRRRRTASTPATSPPPPSPKPP